MQLINATIFLISILVIVSSHATYMTSIYCTKPLTAGTSIMVGNAVAGASRSILVKRGATTLSSGDPYFPGESLTVQISDTTGEYVFETTQGTFAGGGCGGKRHANGVATLVMPPAGSGPIDITGGWATAYSTVQIMASFSLQESVAGTPVQAPVQSPTESSAMLTVVSLQAVQVLGNLTAANLQGHAAAINALEQTLFKLLVQSMARFARPKYVNVTDVLPYTDHIESGEPIEPEERFRQLAGEPETEPPEDESEIETGVRITYLISFNLEDTKYATADELQGSVNIALSVMMDSNLFGMNLLAYDIPSLSGVTSGRLLSTSVANVDVVRTPQPTQEPTNLAPARDDDAYDSSLSTKLSIGLAVGVVSFALVGYAVYRFVFAAEESVSPIMSVLAKLPVVMALAAAAVAVGLVSAWATDSSNDRDFGFLSVPSWSKNVFAYHPIFMVLFFAAQVQAITNWSLFSVKLTAKTAHVLVQLCAIATMIVALVAVVKHTLDNRSPSLVSMHAWIGVAAVAVFGFNFLWGGTMSYLTVYHPDSKLRSRLHPLLAHKFLGAAALFLSAVAINTGIMDQLPRGACGYILSQGVAYEKDYDPAENYQYIPASCRIANGLGVVVLLAALFTFMAMLVRNAPSLNPVMPQQEDGVKHSARELPTPMTVDGNEVAGQL